MKTLTAMLSAATLAAASVLGLGASQASAAYTTVNSPIYAGEDSVAQIMGHVYGGAFVDAGNGVDLTNGLLTATRVDDNDDQALSLGKFSARALARFAASNQTFGLMNAGVLNPLFAVSGMGYGVSGSVTDVNTTGPVHLGRGGNAEIFSSEVAFNYDGKDHMITYLLSGQGVTGKTYVVFFEDWGVKWSDRDFNDMAVEIKAAAVPLPAAFAMGLVTMAGAAASRRFRKAQA